MAERQYSNAWKTRANRDMHFDWILYSIYKYITLDETDMQNTGTQRIENALYL